LSPSSAPWSCSWPSPSPSGCWVSADRRARCDQDYRPPGSGGEAARLSRQPEVLSVTRGGLADEVDSTGYRQRSQTTTTPPGRPSAPGRTLTRPSSTHALLARAVSDPDWRTASQALDDLMRKLLVVHRLLEAEERLAKRERRPDQM
jgi:hypothetical protein